jgi:acetolactate synthase-1/2/3 large subunit
VGRRGADRVVDALLAAGVRHLFSLSGNQIMPIYDATIGRGLGIIHTRHEAATVHMADAWGRLTEEPGVALVTAGPGHLNALSALYDARLAESPLVLLSGHASLSQLGRGAFQELDQVAAARPVAKAAWLARDPAQVGDDITRALDLARTGRPGPVHVSLPNDLLDAPVRDEAPRRREERRAGNAGGTASGASIQAVVRLLADATRPLILTGPAMARAARWESVERFSTLTGVPALPVESPRGLNDPWLHLAAPRLGEADVVVLVGRGPDYAVRFADSPPFAIDCRFVRIDWDDAPAGLADGVTSDGRPDAPTRFVASIAGDPTEAIDQMAAAAETLAWRGGAWRDELRRARQSTPSEWEGFRSRAGGLVHPLQVCAAIQPLLDAGAVLVSDGGEFGQWVQAGTETRIRLINGPAGPIGSAIPMGCAAKLAHPDRAVIVAVGDGTFGFHAFELDTALRHRLPVIVVVGNDARWNAEHQIQRERYGVERLVGCELRPTRYDRVASALGGFGEHVERAGDLAPALARAVGSGLPACVNVLIDGVPAPTYHAGRAAGTRAGGAPH